MTTCCQPQHPPSQQGSSLLELILAAALCALLASLGLPLGRALLLHQRGISAEHTLIRNLQLARWHAVTQGTETVLCPSTDGKRCSRDGNWSNNWLLFDDIDGNHRSDQPDAVIRFDAPPSPSLLRVASARSRTFIRFKPDGRSAGTNLTISICCPEGTLLRQVIVNNAGRPRSERPKTPRPCPH